MENRLFQKKRKKWNARNWTVFVVATFGLVYILLFHYVPMVGLLLGFKDADYSPNLLGTLLFGEWVGFEHFTAFLQDVNFWNVMSNTDRQSHYASAEFPGSDSFCLVAQRGKT